MAFWQCGGRAGFIAGISFFISSFWYRIHLREEITKELCAHDLTCVDSVYGRMDSHAQWYLLNRF